VKLDPSDRNFTRFLWPANVDTPDEIMCKYRFAVVPFGSASSPFMLGAVLDLHLSKFDTISKNVIHFSVICAFLIEQSCVLLGIPTNKR